MVLSEKERRAVFASLSPSPDDEMEDGPDLEHGAAWEAELEHGEKRWAEVDRLSERYAVRPDRSILTACMAVFLDQAAPERGAQGWAPTEQGDALGIRAQLAQGKDGPRSYPVYPRRAREALEAMLARQISGTGGADRMAER